MRFPFIIALYDETITGWLSLNPFSIRKVYAHVADISLYVSRDYHRMGTGRTLLESGIEKAKILGFHKLVLTMFPDNLPALHLYKKFGFVNVGTYHEEGKIDNKWKDTPVMELII